MTDTEQVGSRDPRELARFIDHTVLKAEASRAEVARYCQEARANGFASVCVNAVHAGFVAEQLAGSGVKTCVVVGFPLGASGAAAKADEAALAIAAGAQEIDMVIDIGALIEGDLTRCRADLDAVRAATRGAVLKVIIEACLLDDAQKETACRLAKEAGADFVKTSTGFSTGGATLADIALMRRVVGPAMGVKASGGVRTAEAAFAFLDAGATRIGASASLAIVGAGKITSGKTTSGDTAPAAAGGY
ncbi:deoxyribose-phosphate aldolase [Ancylobacter sp. 6x-1]|uniref:Deoxyribose-phosphate aldolase n=1 Tax=Ancylobacter crimeensis TaxID=2579147 RepID=A0ABT0DDX1_9HYPH|nr:deoxyribose-phosphate aldolase [Ancylobacter crimeensis]MCK0198166.1 deoxyribose-phosphate aldolase [Ancylobacter crimeensis]